MAKRTSVVLTALAANAALAGLKFVAFLLTGSRAMLSETYHSVSDTGNQVFLLVGLRYGRRSRTRVHPFGYGKAQFFYSFLVAVLLFGIAGWESLRNGYAALTGHEGHILTGTVSIGGTVVPAVWVNYAVLLGGIAFEGWALAKAYRNIRLEIEEREWSGVVEAFRKTADVTTLTALTEDTVSVSGLLLALLGVALTSLTGNPLYDAAAALLIGVLLMTAALALGWENQRLLLGESLPAVEEAELEAIVSGWDGVTHVVDFRTVLFGPDDVLLTADVAFDPELDTGDIDDRITAIERALAEADDSVSKVYIEPEE